ncbi:MAG: ComF family protein [Aristaeellaceae bacterium]
MRAWAWLRRADEWLMSAVYPRRTLCLLCGGLSHGAFLCGDCRERLETLRLTGPLCPECGHPVRDGECRFCHGQSLCRMRSVWRHEDAALMLVHRLKYQAVADCAQPLAQGIAELARSMGLPANTVITWVTMPRRRLRERGIDHGRCLAEETARLLGMPCRQLLTRRGEGHTQHGLTRKERLKNLAGAFICEEELYQPVLLVDDVMTTSATAQRCAVSLLEAGARGVVVITATQAGG